MSVALFAFLALEVMDTPSFGRIKIKVSDKQVTRENVVDVINRALHYHDVNSMNCERLYNIYTGKQAILDRVKRFRPEINNKVIINHANEIVSFKTSYLLFAPIIYVARGGADAVDATLTAKVAQFNSMMALADKASHDMRLATMMNIAGHAYRMALPVANFNAEDGTPPFEIFTLDPRTTFVVHNSSLGEKPICGVTYVDRRILVGDTGNYTNKRVYSVYTPTEYFEVMDGKVIHAEPHNLGDVPIVEYINNDARLGSFEIVESILDAINTLASNRVDATEQTVQSIMVFVNCDIDKDKFQEIREQGGIKLRSVEGMPSEIKLLTADLKQADQQVLMDSLYNQLLFITGMPSQSTGGGSDSSNNGATIVRNGWYNAEARAKETDTLWSASENKLRKIVLRICREYDVLDLKPAFVTDKFTRRNYEDLLARSQVLTTMLNNPKIAPHTAYVSSAMFPDPEEAYGEWVRWAKEHPEPVETVPEITKETENIDTKET
jgi:SPP1 family phage portal protein